MHSFLVYRFLKTNTDDIQTTVIIGVRDKNGMQSGVTTLYITSYSIAIKYISLSSSREHSMLLSIGSICEININSS